MISTDSDHDLDCSRSTCLTPCSSALLYRCSWCSQAVWLLSDKLCTVYSYTCCLLLISNEQMTEPICPVLCRTFWTFLVVAGQQLQFSRRNFKIHRWVWWYCEWSDWTLLSWICCVLADICNEHWTGSRLQSKRKEYEASSSYHPSNTNWMNWITWRLYYSAVFDSGTNYNRCRFELSWWIKYACHCSVEMMIYLDINWICYYDFFDSVRVTLRLQLCRFFNFFV